MTVNYTIVGMGVTGTAVLLALADQLKEDARNTQDIPSLSVTIIDKSSRHGPSYAYNPDGHHPGHLLNHPAIEMAMRPVDAEGNISTADFEVAGWHSYDFVEWLKEHRQSLIDAHPNAILATHPGIELESWRPDPAGHYNRALFGYYLQNRCKEAVEILRNLGITVHAFSSTEVIGMHRQDGKIELKLRDLTSKQMSHIVTDKLLLSTGRWSKDMLSEYTYPHYFKHPYPSATIVGTIRPNVPINKRAKHVIIGGMGLTALDSIFSVATGTFYRDDSGKMKYTPDDNHARITAVSRSGYFPIVRGLPKVKLALKYFTKDTIGEIKARNGGYLTLHNLKKLFENELAEQVGEKVDLPTYFQPNTSASAKLQSDIEKARQGNVVYAISRQLLGMQLYSQLAPTDQRYFTKHLRTLFLQNVAAMPMINAEKLAALFDAGVLHSCAIGYTDTSLDLTNRRIKLTYVDDSGSKKVLCGDLMIQAAGDELDIRKNRDPLIRSLLLKQEIIPAHSGGIQVNVRNYAVISKDGDREVESGDVFALGMPVMNWAAERDFASASVKAAYQLAKHWLYEAKTRK